MFGASFNLIPKWRQRFVKYGFKNPVFVKKRNIFVVRTLRFCSNFTSMRYKHFLRNVWRDFRLPMSALATVARKSFNGKFTAKIDFLIDILHIADADVKSLKSLHTLFDKDLDHMLVKFQQNRMVRTIQIFELFDRNG